MTSPSAYVPRINQTLSTNARDSRLPEEQQLGASQFPPKQIHHSWIELRDKETGAAHPIGMRLKLK
jgi:hypothetical protein